MVVIKGDSPTETSIIKTVQVRKTLKISSLFSLPSTILIFCFLVLSKKLPNKLCATKIVYQNALARIVSIIH